ncbi:MAG: hypothetical protein FJ357_03540 [Thaumarchaeota archaeon]|nr:hypothetical protein [Nitrososphaerota archaeon]
MRLLLPIAIFGVLSVMIPESYADSDFIFEGNGFGKINDAVDKAFLQLYVQISDSGQVVFEEGQLSLGTDLYVIDKANVSFFNNKKSIRINAEAGTNTIFASGKRILSIGGDSIYQLNGKTSAGTIFSIFTKLHPSLGTTISDLPTTTNNEILLLVKQTERIEWKSQYKFTIRTFDPKANLMSDFANTSGYLEKIKISATITNPIGDVIKTSNGETHKFGYYDDSIIIPDNARTGIYKLSVTASGEGYQNVTREFTFVVNPLNTRPS